MTKAVIDEPKATRTNSKFWVGYYVKAATDN